MEIIELINHKLEKLGIEYEQYDVEIVLSEVDQFIKNYCHIDNIPNELLYVRANMCIDYIKYEQANTPNENSSDISLTQKTGPLTSISSGGVSYGFANNTGNKGDVSNAHIADLDDLLINYKNQLNTFRRNVW